MNRSEVQPGQAAAAEDAARDWEDPRLVLALEEYRAALESGLPLDRRAFERRYADLGPALAECLDGLDFVHRAAPNLSSTGAETAANVSDVASALPDAAPLGDFRIIRQIGRGGMGVVYEAEQLSLGRRVALKVLPFASALDAKQLQRFKNEAQAAACLRHPHIVAVHAVGSDRGVHYYAMDYIEGQTLAAIIHGLRQQAGLEKGSPAQSTQAIAGLATELSTRVPVFFRSVARLALQAANALAHAHDQGIVHRDIKPANLLIDAKGTLSVTDFGLARVQRGPGLTMTGEVMGTLRYMSPEQALGQQELVDQRTDIYSLGMTLYELLALEPAYSGQDRQALLRQLASEEPRPLHKLNPGVPVELETVIHKAIAREPAERYASAHELAEDLQRFLDDKPVLARRPTLAHRLLKWSRRHRGLVWSMVGVLLVAVVGLGIATARIAREESLTRGALESEQKQRQRAEANFAKVLQAVDEMVHQVTNGPVARIPQAQGSRQDILEQAIKLYEGLLHPGSTDPAERFETGQALLRMARIQAALGRANQSEQTGLQALEVFDGLAHESPDQGHYRSELAACSLWLGGHLQKVPGRQGDAEQHLRRAITVGESLLPGTPAQGHLVILAYHELGYQLQWQLGRAREAEEAYRHCLSLLEQQEDERSASYLAARVNNSLGLLLRQSGRPQEAVQAHERALEILDGLTARSPGKDSSRDYDYERARANNHLAGALWQLERRDESEKVARRALALLRSNIADFPTDIAARQELAAAYRGLGRMLEVTGRRQEAEEVYRETLKLAEALAMERPESADVQRLVIFTLFYLGRNLSAAGKTGEADIIIHRLLDLHPSTIAGLNDLAWMLSTFPGPGFRNPARAVVLAQEAVERAPGDGMLWNTLGVAHYRAGDDKGAMAALQKSMELRNGGDSYDWFFMALIHWRRGERAEARRHYERSVEWMEKHRGRDEELKAFRAEASVVLGAPASAPR